MTYYARRQLADGTVLVGSTRVPGAWPLSQAQWARVCRLPDGERTAALRVVVAANRAAAHAQKEG